MENLKEKERKTENTKRKIMLSSAILSFCIIIIIIAAIIIYQWTNKDKNMAYEIPNSYSFSGNILSTNTVYKGIDLVIEEKDRSITAVTLKNNELLSKKVLNMNIDYGKINDFNVILADYNEDNIKDFIYFLDTAENGHIYKFYTIKENGEISDLDLENIIIDSNKASLKLTKIKDKYEYKIPNFYYDGYKVLAEIGEHLLIGEKNNDVKAISKNSKISLEKGYKAFPRKVLSLKDTPEYIINVNKYLSEVERKSCIEVDLDGDNQKEYLIGFIKDNKIYYSLFNSSGDFIVNVFSIEGKEEVSEKIEIVDIDNDGVMEIIVVKDGAVEVHRYNRGFYY